MSRSSDQTFKRNAEIACLMGDTRLLSSSFYYAMRIFIHQQYYTCTVHMFVFLYFVLSLDTLRQHRFTYLLLRYIDDVTSDHVTPVASICRAD